MKKLCLISLLVVGFSFQYGNSQTGCLGEGKSVGDSNKHFLQKSKSSGSGHAVLSDKSICVPEGQKPIESASSQNDSQLDYETRHMVEAAIQAFSRQSESLVQDSADVLMNANDAQEQDIMDALGESESVPSDNSGLHLQQRDAGDMLEILTPYLAADKESFARDVIESLLHYDMTLDAMSNKIAE